MPRPLPLLLPVLLALARASAAPAVPPPSPPYVAPVPERAQWILSVPGAPEGGAAGKEAAPAPGGRRIVKIAFAKAGRTARRVVSYSDGTTAEAWFADGMELDAAPGGAVQVVDLGVFRGPDQAPGNPLLPPGGFPGTEWVGTDSYDAAVPYRKATAYHYALADAGRGGAEAWIDAATRLPLAFVSQGTTYAYEMQDPPAGPLELPAACRAALDRYRKAAERRSQLDAGAPR